MPMSVDHDVELGLAQQQDQAAGSRFAGLEAVDLRTSVVASRSSIRRLADLGA